MDAYKAYQYYLAIKLHFTTDNYDIRIHKGRVKAPYQSFIKRRDVKLFEKFATIYKDQEYIKFLASNFIYGNYNVVYDTTNAPIQIYKHFQKQIQSITHVFENDLTNLTFNINMGVNHEDYCTQIFNQYIGNKISAETIIILDTLENIVDNVHLMMFDCQLRTIRKAQMFVKFNKPNIIKHYCNFIKEIKANG